MKRVRPLPKSVCSPYFSVAALAQPAAAISESSVAAAIALWLLRTYSPFSLSSVSPPNARMKDANRDASSPNSSPRGLAAESVAPENGCFAALQAASFKPSGVFGMPSKKMLAPVPNQLKIPLHGKSRFGQTKASPPWIR